MLCKYFAAFSVASSLQVTLQFYFQIFYTTVPNKIVIKLTKLKKKDCQAKVSRGYGCKTISNKKHIQRKKSSKEVCSYRISAEKRYKNIHIGYVCVCVCMCIYIYIYILHANTKIKTCKITKYCNVTSVLFPVYGLYFVKSIDIDIILFW